MNNLYKAYIEKHAVRENAQNDSGEKRFQNRATNFFNRDAIQ